MSDKPTLPIMDVPDALDCIIKTCTQTEKNCLQLHIAHNRIIAEDVILPRNLSETFVSAVDGYAVIASDGKNTRTVIPPKFNAKDEDELMMHGKTMQVKADDTIPEGADAIIAEKDVTLVMGPNEHDDEMQIKVHVEPEYNQNINRKVVASDTRRLAEIGDRLNGARVTMFACNRVYEVQVSKRPTITILTTGNNVRDNRCLTGDGEVYDGGKYFLIYLFREQYCECSDGGISPNNRPAFINLFNKALSEHSIIIILENPGVLNIREILANEYKITLHFDEINMLPGRKLTFGSMDGSKLVFLMSDHITYAMMHILLLVIPSTRYMERCRSWDYPKKKVYCPQGVGNEAESPFYYFVEVTAQLDKLVGILLKCGAQVEDVQAANGLMIIPVNTPDGSFGPFETYIFAEYC